MITKPRNRGHQPVALEETQPHQVGECIGIRRKALSSASWHPTEIARPKESTMGIRQFGIPRRRVDLAAWVRDDLPIPEIINECRVVGVEQPRPTHQSERKHMYVVRSANSLPAKLHVMIVYCSVRYRARTSVSQGAPEPLDESAGPGSIPLGASLPLPTVRVGSTTNRRIGCQPAGGRFQILRMPRWHQRWRTFTVRSTAAFLP